MLKRSMLAAAAVVLVGGGAAWAQMPPPEGGPEHHEGWRMHHPHGGDGAAFFRFRRGDAEMDIKCPANESVQACVSAASALFDKVSAAPQARPPGQ